MLTSVAFLVQDNILIGSHADTKNKIVYLYIKKIYLENKYMQYGHYILTLNSYGVQPNINVYTNTLVLSNFF